MILGGWTSIDSVLAEIDALTNIDILQIWMRDIPVTMRGIGGLVVHGGQEGFTVCTSRSTCRTPG